MSGRLPQAEAGSPGMSSVLARNIRAMTEQRERKQRRRGLQERAADAITRFSGSIPFVYLHLLIFGFWILANLGFIPFVEPWDPSLVVLAMAASVEAIFLSTFVLISQNRMAALAEQRAELDLQINLLSEHEITRLVQIVASIAEKLQVPLPAESDLHEIKQDVRPEAVLEEIEPLTQSAQK
ncbi:MAG TPA: DUF1003 domain-containing protein [Geminicoccus sp.]|nr:DUF1003 domain-containing protein [Geminicoccus sp.]HEX2525825.1 DUF1003 domain-containing protein [Geminicoccus sp.]